jgi:hypothetical protein
MNGRKPGNYSLLNQQCGSVAVQNGGMVYIFTHFIFQLYYMIV